MRELSLRLHVPLDVDAQYCDIVRRGEDYFLRLKGRGEREYEILYLDFAPAVAALQASGLIERPPVIPDAMGADHWKPVALAHRALRVTLGDHGALTIEPRAGGGIAAADDPLYIGAVDFILAQVVPRFRQHAIPVGDLATAAMVNAVYNKRTRPGAASRGGGGHGHG